MAAEGRAASVGEERPVIGIGHEGPIHVVFQITDDRMANGVHRGLYTLRKLYDGYRKAGFEPDQIHVAAVIHGAASEHLLTDEAWNAHRNESGGNPSGDLIAELSRNGVSVELCDVRRVTNGWEKADIHPDVLLVSNAYERLVDLQMRGYAYVKL